jgi:HSP20 family protein
VRSAAVTGRSFDGSPAPRARQPSARSEGKTLRRRQGKFAYHASLPADADPEQIHAQLTDGVLTVRVPKAVKACSRRIEIKE